MVVLLGARRSNWGTWWRSRQQCDLSSLAVIQPCAHTAGEHGLPKSPRSLKLRIQHDNLDGLLIEVLGKGSSK